MHPPKDLLDRAIEAMGKAYAPYSNFRVGCALRCSEGKIFSGCNVENASYGLTICAERVAVGAAVAQGAKKIVEAVIVTDTPAPTPPCGACRQVLLEFSENLKLWSVNLQGQGNCHTLEELLPKAFGPKSLGFPKE
ncbi:MAG: cytidine deaminase [Gemmataceae bacterium]|nr:cytidine deaminase [Gemmataceae bacterium]